MKRICLPVLMGIGAAPAVWAEEETKIIEEIVVTAEPLGRSVDELTQSALVIGGDELLHKAANSIGETLAGELGMSSSYFGPVAGRPIIRGQESARVAVLESGVSTLDAADLSPDHAVPIEPLFADRIEIIRGPATLLYGSSASGGVVNVIDSRVPTALPDDALTAAMEVRGDTAAHERAAAARLDGAAGAIAWHLDGFDRRSNDIEISDFATADPAARPAEERRGTVANSYGEADGFAGGATLIGDGGYLGVAVSRYATSYGLPGPEEEHEHEAGAEDHVEEAALFPGPFIDLRQTRIDVRGELELGGVFERARLRVARNDYRHQEIEPTGDVATTFDNEAWEARAELILAPLGNLRSAVGVQLHNRDFSALGAEAFVPVTQSRGIGVFVLEEYAFDGGTAEFGARYERLEHDTAALADYGRNALSLAGGVKWEVSEAMDFNVNLSRSQRLAGIEELYSDGAHLATGLFEVGLVAQGDMRVRVETANNLDASLHYHGASFDWKLNAFINAIDDYIYRVENGEVEDGLPLAPYRQEDARFHGIEAETTVDLGHLAPGVSARLFGDYVRGRTGDADLPRVQPWRLGLSLDYTGERWSADVQAIRHGRQHDISTFRTGAYTLLGASLTLHVLDSGPLAWDVFLKGSNLLDEDARRSTSFRAAYVPLPGLSLQAGVRMRFR
ncbi:MAG: TonB-dependent receptor [Pseudomonadales bacterium]|nr:TonB-dependent receptor [Pseudomonadales bacterium]